MAGEVESVGIEVTKCNTGDQVFGATKLRLGAYGEYLCLPANYTLVPKPYNVSFEEAAAIPLGGFESVIYPNAEMTAFGSSNIPFCSVLLVCDYS